MLQFLLLWSCTSSTSYKYRIGVSECVGGRWRDRANNEMLSAQHLYDNVEAGRKMGEYAAMLCRDSIKPAGRRPIVLEMTGPLGISPAA